MPFIEFEREVRALGPGVLTVGSGPEAGWRIGGRGLDSVHLLLSAQPGGRALLIRGSSSAAVSINGTDLVPLRTLLSFGDRVAIGTAEFRYRQLAPGDNTPAGYVRDVRRGRVYQLRAQSTIGRDLSSTVIVHEPDVSRLHAEIVQRDEQFVVVPHGSSVTSFNGARVVAPMPLQEGYEITIGRTLLRFTTALPTSSGLHPDMAARGAGAMARESQAQTTFIGTIERQEHRVRAARRRLTRAASIAVVAIAAAAVIVSLYVDARTKVAGRATGPAITRRATRASSASGARGRATRSVAPPSPSTPR